MEEIFGYIERITYQNPENGYTVAQLQQPKSSQLSCIVGTMTALQAGETIRCQGTWKNHLVHGKQFEVAEYKIEAPADILGIKKYLGSGLIKGIGPVYAGKIVEKFKEETLHIIDKFPERLTEIGGIGLKRIDKIKQCWYEQKSIREVMIFLQGHGITPTFSQKIFKTYGDQSLKVLKENPYQLARDIFGIGFKTADSLAQKLGIAKDATQRIDAGIEYSLMELSDDGNVCYPKDEFLKEAEVILEVSAAQIDDRLASLKEAERIELFDLIHDNQKKLFIWIKPLFVAEVGIAREIKRLVSSSCQLRQVDTEKAVGWIQEQLHIELAENQKVAVANSLIQKLQIITGGPGTGKSTITKAILGITEKLTPRILLAAPTGRAAKRMCEITGKGASTIHSLLEYDFKTGGFKRNRKSPLECDLLIIDESSMIDTMLMYNLLKAIPSSARVIFVGDINQLPSVGPGNVLKDMIASRTIPVTMLNHIFRQAAGSQIIINAHRINEGSFPNIYNKPDSDFFFLEAIEPNDALNSIVNLVTHRLPRKYGFNPIQDIQVLAPMKRGIIGTQNLNVVLQEALNKKENPLFRNGQKFLVGDKVMQIRNNYSKSVFNGDVGVISHINHIDQEVMVEFDGKDVMYEFSDLDEIVLAYAVSVHKYQGSECPCVVMPVHTTHFKLLHRNLLYTGVTRGKRLVVLVGTKKALAIAVKNDEVKRRYTGLQQALIEINQ